MLKKFVTSNHRDRDAKFPQVLMTIRTTPQESTGVLSVEMMIPLHLLYQQREANLATARMTSPYVDDLETHFGVTSAFAQQTLEKNAEGHSMYYDKKTSQTEFQVRDPVWYYLFV